MTADLSPPAPPAASTPVARAIVEGEVRHVLTIIGTAAIAHGIATQGDVNAALPAAADYVAGAALVLWPMAWSALSKLAAESLPRLALRAFAAGVLSGPAQPLPRLSPRFEISVAIAPSPCPPAPMPADVQENTMSLFPDFHVVFANDAQKAIIKKALADAGHVVELAADSAGDQLVLALKGTSVGTFIASEIVTLKDSDLTGLEKMEQVVARAIPAAITLFAAGGVVKTALEVEDAVRATAQLIYNDIVSTTVPALATDVATIVAASAEGVSISTKAA